MARRRYRRKSSPLGDVAYIGARLPWWGALLLGVVTFALFYFALPAWLSAKLAEQSTNKFYPILEAVFERRMHWLQWLGIACGLVGVYFAARNYILTSRAGANERGLVAWLAKLLGRSID